MSERLRASILVIGDEILGGFVQDTNSGWMAGVLRDVGVPLDRVVTMPDDIEAITSELDRELGRSRPRVVLTSGGIGSTPDDRTLEAVAATLGRGLVVEPTIDARITSAIEWTARQGVAVTDDHEESMRKMAMVPEESYLLPGAPHFVPGIAVDVDGGSRAGGATIVVLPGIPSHLERIVTESVVPVLLEGHGTPDHIVELTHGYPESALNPAFARLVAEYPDVHLGSYPGVECLVRLKGPRDRVEAALRVVEDYLAELNAEPGAASLRDAWQTRFR
jgi:molybdenum cofactor synthesis domain-containing protein